MTWSGNLVIRGDHPNDHPAKKFDLKIKKTEALDSYVDCIYQADTIAKFYAYFRRRVTSQITFELYHNF